METFRTLGSLGKPCKKYKRVRYVLTDAEGRRGKLGTSAAFPQPIDDDYSEITLENFKKCFVTITGKQQQRSHLGCHWEEYCTSTRICVPQTKTIQTKTKGKTSN